MPASMPSSRPCARNWPNDVRAEAWDEPVARHTMRRGLNRSSSEVIRRLDTARLGAAGVAKALARPPAAVDAEVHRRVEEILAAVREKGDAALLEFTERFDRVRLTAGGLAVSSAEMEAALDAVGEATVR